MSILNSIRKVYLEFSNQSKVSSDTLSLICNDTLDNDCEGSITDAITNSVITYDYDHDANDVYLSFAVGDNVILSDQRYVLDNTSFMDALDSLINDAGYSDILSTDTVIYNVNQYGEMYNLLGEISQGYITNVKQSASQLIGVIQSKSGINNSDKERLISAIQCAQDSGSISQEAWLSILTTIFKQSENQVSGSTMVPVTDSAYALTSVIQIVTSVIKSIMSTILTLLVVILQGIYKVIAIALQGLVSLVQSFTNTEIEIKQDDNTSYIKGSNCIIFKDYGDRKVDVIYNGDDKDYYSPYMNGILNSHPGIDMFFWQQTDHDFFINGRMILNVEPTRFHNYLASKITYTSTHGGTQYIATINSNLYPLPSEDSTDSFYLTDEESIRIKYDSEYADQVMMASLCAMGLPLVSNQGQIQFNDISSVGSFNDITIYDLGGLCAFYGYTTNFLDFKQSSNVIMYRKMWTAIQSYCDGSSVIDWGDIFHIITADNVPGILYSTSEQYSYSQLDEIITSWLGCYFQWLTSPENRVSFIFNNTYRRNMPRYVVDAIPSGYTFTPGQFSVAELVTAVATIAITATAIFIGGKLIKRAIVNKTRISQLRRTQNINNLRSAYIANPTSSNAKELNKAINRYNRIGGLLGWNSYDLTNNWYSPRSTLITTTSSDLLYGMRTDQSNLEYITKLIKG